jgi:hypothetical protein
VTYVLAGIDTTAVAIPPDAVAGIRAWDEEIWRQLRGEAGTDPEGSRNTSEDFKASTRQGEER